MNWPSPPSLRQGLAGLWSALLVLSCGLLVPAPAAPPTAANPPASPATGSVAAGPVAAGSVTPGSTATGSVAAPGGDDTVVTVTILYTNDEHGWMEGAEPGGGAANLSGLWREREGFHPEAETYLLLSGGDMWTGPAISTWFAGTSMVEVMNEMGYRAAAMGNHEFDFGLAQLADHARAASFPFVSANLRYRDDGQTPTDLGILPYVVLPAGPVQVGILGLTTTRTPSTTKPDNVATFDFLDYETALRQVVPRARADGAELILVPGHVCRPELEALAERIVDLGVHLLGAGHCNELFAARSGDIILLGGGARLASYAYARLTFDRASDTVLDAALAVRLNVGGPADPIVEAVVRRWQAAAAAELNVVIGYTERGIARRSPAMQDLIVTSWLAAYPADFALTNLGGMRADLPPGEISIGDIVGMMPFDNVIIEVQLTGRELNAVLRGRQGNTAAGGLFWDGQAWIDAATRAPLDPDRRYRVLVNDFMFMGGDGYRFNTYDPGGYDTSINWRQPVIDWILGQESTAGSPLDPALTGLAGP